jgi:hypothetical protein
MTIIDAVEGAIGAFWIVAAAAWIRLAFIRLPSSMDGNIADARRALDSQLRWSRFAALSAGLAALIQAIEIGLIRADVDIGPLHMFHIS